MGPGRSYHVNCMGGAIDLPSQQFKEAAVAVYFEVRIDTQSKSFAQSDDSIAVLNGKEEARVGKKTASAHCHQRLA